MRARILPDLSQPSAVSAAQREALSRPETVSRDYETASVQSLLKFGLDPIVPMKDADKSWRAVKAQWKKDAESVGEEFSTFSMGSYAAFDALTDRQRDAARLVFTQLRRHAGWPVRPAPLPQSRSGLAGSGDGGRHRCGHRRLQGPASARSRAEQCRDFS